MRLFLIVLGAALSVSAAAPEAAAQAERASWTDGDAGSRRVTHLVTASAAALAYAASATVLKGTFADDECRWCDPPGLDRSVRNALVWDNPRRASSISDVTGYVAAPLLSLGLTAVMAVRDAGDTESRFGRALDDTLPIVETVLYSQLFVQAVKFSVARQRPRVHFGGGAAGDDDHEANLSFFSGHASLTFALATAAGVVAHRRNSEAEPVIWAVGMGLAATTSYLRMAADQHYFTDVTVGALFGIGAGVLIPTLLDHDRDDDENGSQQTMILPTPTSLAFTGVF